MSSLKPFQLKEILSGTTSLHLHVKIRTSEFLCIFLSFITNPWYLFVCNLFADPKFLVGRYWAKRAPMDMSLVLILIQLQHLMLRCVESLSFCFCVIINDVPLSIYIYIYRNIYI